MKAPLSLESFADFLATMPPDQEYDYGQPSTCAIAQFMAHLGFSNVDYSSITAQPRYGAGPSLPWDFFRVSNHVGHKLTFGGAHQRACEILAENAAVSAGKGTS